MIMRMWMSIARVILLVLVTSGISVGQTDHCSSQPCVAGNTGRCISSSESFLCICDKLSYGQRCEHNLTSGSVVERFSDSSGSFNSPGYPSPTENRLDFYYYVIQVPSAREIRFEFDAFCMERNKDFLFYGPGPSPDISPFPRGSPLHGCHNTTVQPDIYIQGESAWFRIQTDNNIRSEGFKVIYSADINNCGSSPCQNAGDCSDVEDGYNCSCVAGYKGVNCEIDINECESGPCLHGSTCFHGTDVYICLCTIGFTGTNCETDIDECGSDPCLNGATCIDLANMYVCDCAYGYEGLYCEIMSDPCFSDPCVNGATCHGFTDGYNCTCQDGFTGLNCSQRVSPCESNPCLHALMCFDMPEGDGFNCLCTPGYTGLQCEGEIDECLSNPCQNDAFCVDQIAGYLCICQRGYLGLTCSEEINECASFPCSDGSTCLDMPGDYSCECAAGLQGRNCHEDVDECETSPCLEGSTCINLSNDYVCLCDNGFTGRNCSTKIDECEPSPCQNNATCVDHVGFYQCLCSPGYSGINCSQVDNCRVEGTWHNRFNDTIVLRETTACRLTGEDYYFSQADATSPEPAFILGYANTTSDYPILAFTSLRDSGSTVRSWTGQCLLCEGQEILYTTWSETRAAEECSFRVHEATGIGFDQWTRYEQGLVPGRFSP